MNKLPDTGGPAYPQIGEEFNTDTLAHHVVTTHQGATLRDMFATAAMKSLIGPVWPSAEDRKEIANLAYAMADEMLRARSSPRPWTP
jgi:hypothetical protein